jgi:SH3-like domain-containing protein
MLTDDEMDALWKAIRREGRALTEREQKFLARCGDSGMSADEWAAHWETLPDYEQYREWERICERDLKEGVYRAIRDGLRFSIAEQKYLRTQLALATLEGAEANAALRAWAERYEQGCEDAQIQRSNSRQQVEGREQLDNLADVLIYADAAGKK